MPASPIVKEMTPPDNWVHLQKTMIPDDETGCYWSVWYDPPTKEGELFSSSGIIVFCKCTQLSGSVISFTIGELGIFFSFPL